ncbi:MAG TPA: ATP-binding protein [Draconibacterium sp.]|nr:ATP-binding protein [Draconibacterium sp.]
MAETLEFNIKGGDFNQAGRASSKIKKKLKQMGVEDVTVKRIVVASYEAELNVVAHASNGKLTAIFEPDFIMVNVTDSGPGIENIDLAMEAGFSTATKRVREMGFGAGMGLPNIKKNTDKLEITSKVGEGTKLEMVIYY